MSAWRRYGLSLTLGILFLSSWGGQAYAQWLEHSADQIAHNQPPGEGFWPAFWSASLENWQSEFLQLFTFVVLTAYLIHEGSHESKDSSERQESKIDQILIRLDRLER
jgi:hypothetical protein